MAISYKFQAYGVLIGKVEYLRGKMTLDCRLQRQDESKTG